MACSHALLIFLLEAHFEELNGRALECLKCKRLVLSRPVCKSLRSSFVVS